MSAAVGCGMGQVIEIKLTHEQTEDLRRIVGRPSEAARLVRRARVVLMSDAGVSGREIAFRLDLSPEHVSVIRSRFRAEGVAGLADRPKSGRKGPRGFRSDGGAPRADGDVATAGRTQPVDDAAAGQAGGPDGGLRVGRSSSQRPQAPLGADLQGQSRPGLRRQSEGRRRAVPQPARARRGAERGREDGDPRSRADAVAAAAAFGPRRAPHTHDYTRHGVVDLYAALEVVTGNVTHRVTESHTATDFLAFMKTVVRRYPRKQLHVVLDNSSSHGT